MRENVPLHVEERARRLGLIVVEGCASLAAVLELAKQEFVVADEDWAGCISVISCSFVGLAEFLQNILHEDRGLTEDCRGSL